MNERQTELFLQALINLRDNGPKHFSMGVCGNIFDACDVYIPREIIEQEIWDMAPDWPYYSGDTKYPVPHPSYSPRRAYNVAHLHDNMWDKDTEYGKMRYNLLNFLIAETEKALK